MTLHELIASKIAELDSEKAGPAADFFGVTKQQMAVCKRKKEYPFDFAEKIFATFDYEPDPVDGEGLPVEEDAYIEEPPTAPPAGGRTPRAGSTAPMTVAPGVRPSDGSPVVVPPRTSLMRAPEVVRVTPHPQSSGDIVQAVVAALAALGYGNGNQPVDIEMPGGNAADQLPRNFGKNWNRPYREPGPQVEPPRAGPQRARITRRQ